MILIVGGIETITLSSVLIYFKQYKYLVYFLEPLKMEHHKHLSLYLNSGVTEFLKLENKILLKIKKH